MIYKPEYFDLEELVCPHIFYKFGEFIWQRFDERLLKTMDFIREKLGAVFVNNWDSSEYLNSEYVMYIRSRIKAGLSVDENKAPAKPKGIFTQRGYRCNLCSIPSGKTKANELYASAHTCFQAVDFDVQGRTAEEVRKWIVDNAYKMPFPVRLEKGVSWVHLDIVNSEQKVQLINP
jgi:hypothetical protein